jgi:hypothetical protein
MAEEQPETEATPKRARKTYSERAAASLRSARRSGQELSDPDERTQFLLAEANVLVLLELADAIRGSNSAEE